MIIYADDGAMKTNQQPLILLELFQVDINFVCIIINGVYLKQNVFASVEQSTHRYYWCFHKQQNP